MPASGYIADTFVAGEQPTTSKWNELWGNDASFNNGNGFNDGILIARHFGTNAVPAVGLATTAIHLGRNTNAVTTVVTAGAGDVSVVAVTVTIPSGGRDIEIVSTIPNISAGGAAIGVAKIFSGTTGGTQLQGVSKKFQDVGDVNWFGFNAYDAAPTAGTKTYTLSLSASTNNLQYNVSSFAPAQIEVKVI